jgi:hypothetical protein
MNLDDLGISGLSDLTPEQRSVVKHLMFIDEIADQEMGVAFLRMIYYQTWGESHNGRNQ